MQRLGLFCRPALAIDDYSRVFFAAIKPDETKASYTQFLREAVIAYAGLGVRIDRVMTDNGAGYKKIFDRSALNWVCATSEPAPTRSRPMERPNASCRPACASGPMPDPTRAQLSAKPRCSRSSTTLNHQPPMSRIPAMNNLLKLDN